MTASSQTPPEAQAPEPPHGDYPLADPSPVFATFGLAVPAPAGSPAEAPVTTVEAAAAVLSAEMDEREGWSSAQQLAEAERQAGILFDAASVEAAVSAAREQAHAEDKAELAERGRQLALMAGVRRQLDAVLRVCEGRPGTDLLLTAVVAAAAEYGTTPYDTVPMTLTWTGSVTIPDAHSIRKQAIVHCTSSHGARADLVITGDARLKLASLLDAVTRDVNAPCLTPGCGAEEDLDPSDPALFGWARVEVAGVEGGPRWYCTPMCVSNALARAGDDLALADDQAAVGGGL